MSALRAAAAAALLLAAAAACDRVGTISFGLVFPPGTDGLPEGTQLVRLRLDRPATVIEAPVNEDGSFDLVLEVPGENVYSQVTFEAVGAAGEILARGRSAPLPIGSYEDAMVLYVAPPRSFAEAPIAPAAARAEAAAVALPYGALLAGGRDGDGVRRDDVVVYNVYYHALELGEPLPEARAAMAAGVGSYERVYFFGGTGAADAPTADAWRFDTRTPPDGEYTVLESAPALARAGAAVAVIDVDRFLVTGDPPLLLDGTANAERAVAFTGAPAEAAAATTATTVAPADEDPFVVLVGPAGAALYDVAADAFASLGGPGRAGHGATRTTAGAVVALGGVDPATGDLATGALRVTRAGVEELPAVLARGRTEPAVARVGDLIVVAGGFDAAGAALDDAELLDATTLGPVAAIPLFAPRGAAVAIPLANDSLLLASGRSSAGGPPVLAYELFTP